MIIGCLGDKHINLAEHKHDKETLKKWAKKGIILCPTCGKPYEYCHGKIIGGYFRHKEKNILEDKFSEPETSEHIQGKNNLYNWLLKQNGVSNVELEAWMPETHQKPDIKFLYNGEQYVLEYQCSPISGEYIERHELYQAAGIKDIWVLGREKYFSKSIKSIEKDVFIYYDPCTRRFLEGEEYNNDDDYRLNAKWVSEENTYFDEEIYTNDYITEKCIDEFKSYIKEQKDKIVSICKKYGLKTNFNVKCDFRIYGFPKDTSNTYHYIDCDMDTFRFKKRVSKYWYNSNSGKSHHDYDIEKCFDISTVNNIDSYIKCLENLIQKWI